MKLKKYVFTKVSSTNDIAMKKIKRGLKSGIIISSNQIRGRGRYGHKWISMKGNLFMSVFFSINTNTALKKLTSQCCTLVRKSLTELVNIKIKIKKPNDLLINNKKICGILQETVFFNNSKFAIIGIGVNINSSPIIKKYPTTYINLFCKKKITILKISKEIKKNFETYLKTKK